jgi:uncharacterized lipoprotein YddW (UPF0748 family)
MKKAKHLIIGLLSIIFLFVFIGPKINGSSNLITLTRSGMIVYHYNTVNPVMIPEHVETKDYEFRAVWVATVFNLNMPLHTSEAQYKTAFQNLIADVKAKNMNAIFFQVRSMNDAFYESDYAPFSRYLAGAEGVDPGWDVIAYMVDYAHSQGIEFHAWLNPYRVGNSSLDKTNFLNTLHPTNFARMNPELVVAGNISSGNYPYILNPGEPAVKQYIRNVVVELMEKYDVDGIHFDDYFYPYSGISSDNSTYTTYAPGGMTIADWRRENINDVIRGVKEDVDAHNDVHGKDIRFGVSPFGIWRSGGEGSNTSTSALQSYSAQFADSKKWVEEEWVHYICPQVYWNFSHNLAPYADVVDWWASITRGTNVDLIIGHSPYHAATNSWLSDELVMQIKYNQKHPEIKGSSMYSFAYINHTHLNNVRSNNYSNQTLGTWEMSAIASPTISLSGTLDQGKYRTNVTATLSSSYPIYYKINDGTWILYEEPIVISTQGTTALYAKSVDGLEESLIVSQSIVIEKINTVLPTIVLTGDQIGSDYVTGTTLSFTASEPIYVAINHGSIGEWFLYTEPIVLTSLGNYFIQAKTINSEGIESSVTTRLIKIVQACFSEPVISITGVGNPPFYRSATLSFNYQATNMQYRINGGTWQTYTSAVDLTDAGSYLIEYRNIDACSTIYSREIEVMTDVYEPEILINGPYDGWFYTDVVTITFTPHNTRDIIKFRLHNGKSWTTWQTFTNTIELTINATYTLEYYSEDLAGNQTETFEARIRLNIPPTENNQYIYRDGNIVTYYNTNIPVELPINYTEKEQEVRAIWVATVSNIDIGLHTSEADYKARINIMLNRIAELNFNTVFFQVRPMNDAFYPSSYAPFSRYLTGTEGGNPGWDVLAYIIEQAHLRGLELHAWLNPYRVSTSTHLTKEQQLSLLHNDNFAKQNPNLVMVDNNGALILNPGEPMVRAYVKNVVEELVVNYNLDGIHFDDYFYSYSGMSVLQDQATYDRTKLTGQTLADWRRENVNTLVREIFEIVEFYNVTNQRTVKFGISPFGIWKSGGIDGSNTSSVTLQSYSAQFADSKRWVEEGWLHYIIPQLYWEFSHGLAPFADLVDWWANLTEGTGVDLIIGHGFYRYADNSWKDDNEITEQLRYISKFDNIVGSAFFSYRTLNSSHASVTQALDRIQNSYWTTYASFPWMSQVEKPVPIVCGTNEELIDGECVIIAPTCGTNEELIDGVCTIIVPTCGTNEELIDGECVIKIPVDDEPRNNTFVLIVSTVGSVMAIGFGWFVFRKLRLRP